MSERITLPLGVKPEFFDRQTYVSAIYRLDPEETSKFCGHGNPRLRVSINIVSELLPSGGRYNHTIFPDGRSVIEGPADDLDPLLSARELKQG